MEFSVGDVVKVMDYGHRVANQIMALKSIKFLLTSRLPFNFNDEFNNTSYTTCNKKYANVEWKIIDKTECNSITIFRLRTRTKYDMLFIYDINCAKYLHLVRKVKKR